MKKCLVMAAMAILVLLIAGCPDATQLPSYSWQDLGPAFFTPGNASHLSLKVVDNVPWLAFRDSENNIHRLSVMRQNTATGQWSLYGGQQVSTQQVTNVRMAIMDNQPIVAFRSVENMTTNSGKVLHYDGSDWVQVGSDFCGGSGLIGDQPVNAFAFAVEGTTPYVAYLEPASPNPKFRLKKHNGSNWINPSLVAEATTMDSIAFALVSSSEWYCAAQNTTTGEVAAFKEDGTVWTPLYTGSPVSAGSAGKLAMAALPGQVWLAYVDGANGSQLTVQHYDGSAWQAIGSAGFTSGSGAISAVSLIVVSASEIYLCYDRSGSSVYVEHWNGSGWSTLGGGRVNESNIHASNPTMDYNNGRLYLAYQATRFENATPIQYGAAAKVWAP